MFSDKGEEAQTLAQKVAKFFGGTEHGSHGMRIDRDIARNQQLKITDMEKDQELQDQILSLYHLSTLGFELTSAVKSVASDKGHIWITNVRIANVVRSA